MSQRVNKHHPFLRKYLYSNKNHRKQLIKSATPEQIRCLCECTLNVLNCCVPISDLKKQKLGRHRKLVRKVAIDKLPIQDKHKLFSQKGGGIILPLIVSAVLSLLGNRLRQ